MSNGNGSVAPSCPISFSQPTQAVPTIKATVAPIPHVTNLRDVINALRQLNSALQHITRGTPQINNVFPPQPIDMREPFPGYARGTWDEIGRGYVQQLVVNPDDTTQSIPMKVISYVEFQESATGNNLLYETP